MNVTVNAQLREMVATKHYTTQFSGTQFLRLKCSFVAASKLPTLTSEFTKILFSEAEARGFGAESRDFFAIHFSTLFRLNGTRFQQSLFTKKMHASTKKHHTKKRQPPIFKIKLILPRFDQTSRQKHNTGPVGSCTILQL